MAGLPAESARGAIRIIDVGHHPGDTMVSLVARRDRALWSVSNVCAGSWRCTPDGKSHAVRDYTLDGEASRDVDAILAQLKTGIEPDGERARPDVISGQQEVLIDDGGFRRSYRRSGQWGETLGRLKRLLSRAQ